MSSQRVAVVRCTLLALVEQICPGSAKVDNLGASISILQSRITALWHGDAHSGHLGPWACLLALATLLQPVRSTTNLVEAVWMSHEETCWWTMVLSKTLTSAQALLHYGPCTATLAQPGHQELSERNVAQHPCSRKHRRCQRHRR